METNVNWQHPLVIWRLKQVDVNFSGAMDTAVKVWRSEMPSCNMPIKLYETFYSIFNSKLKTTMEKAFILKSHEGKLSKPYNVLGMPVHLKVSGNDTAGQMSMFIAEYKRNEGPPLHLHDNDEAFFIIEGEFIFQAGEERFTGAAGDTIFIPRNTPHTTLTSSETGKMLFTVNPSGNVEKIFEKLDSYKEMPSIEEIVRVHEELGLRIVGPPLHL